MESYGLVNDDWLTVLYDERHMWIPTYMKHLFWAGMKTTQRSESINSFVDKYVKRDTRLYEFVERKVLRCYGELGEFGENSAMRVKHVLTNFPFEKVFPFEKGFQKVYTDAKFEEIQEQLERLLYVSDVSKTKLLNNVVEHSVEDIAWIYLKDQRKDSY
ncbi:protein FAR-RED IMPAIRED RESPONSE 1-like [Chenopodium quinoa]|uniref:protein FAR-RED IMPAIRED RESPONSE 1-like n=1 Tax=Chenopodium quinoa TaxID=63459 RepID=UPI000B77BD7E|nr:protein FAR-RED IMPAIRED RESPONSE 1-like [Chenopodium quinoa]